MSNDVDYNSNENIYKFEFNNILILLTLINNIIISFFIAILHFKFIKESYFFKLFSHYLQTFSLI